MSPDWMKRAHCASPDTPTEIFFPTSGRHRDTPYEICAGCSVVTECLEYALQWPTTVGVWGGTSGKQRMWIRKTRGMAPADSATMKDPA